MKKLLILILGIIFGYVLIDAQVISWYRIQEMFLFDNFHMYGVICTAILSSACLLWLYRRWQNGRAQIITAKPLNRGTVIGGILFGLGWSITGACPGPIYALIGHGHTIYIVVLLAALAGVVLYGFSLRKSDHSTTFFG